MKITNRTGIRLTDSQTYCCSERTSAILHRRLGRCCFTLGLRLVSDFILVPKLRLGTTDRETPFRRAAEHLSPPWGMLPRNRVSQSGVPKRSLGTRGISAVGL